MGIFSPNYAKPGPGVKKGGPEERRFIIFFKIWGRKFGKLFQLNFIFVLSCLPIVAVLFLFSYIGQYIPNDFFRALVQMLPLSLLAIPVSAMTYVTRNFASESPTFMWFDFWKTLKNNWKVSLIHGLLTYICGFCLTLSYGFYQSQLLNNWFLYIPLVFVVILSIILIFVQYYAFTLIVTFDMRYRDILKDCILFAFIGIFRNFGLSLFMVPVWSLTYLLLFNSQLIEYGTPLLIIPILCLGLCSFSSFLCSFGTYGLIMRMMITPTEKDELDEDDEKASTFGDVKDGDHYQPIEEKKAEYVFENGRLVQKINSDAEKIFEDNE